MKPLRAQKLRTELEALYERYNDSSFLANDPLGCVSPSLAPADFEIVSFIAAGLSYGRVEQIRKSILYYLQVSGTVMGSGPNGEGLAEALKSLESKRDHSRLLKGYEPWKHRLQTAQDISALSMRLGLVLRDHGSLARLFQNSGMPSPKEQLIQFSLSLGGRNRKIASKDGSWSGWGLSSFCPSPSDGSACKRLLMWLRWMIRKDRVDPGIWLNPELVDPQQAPPSASRLFHPVDTHIFNWAKRQRLLQRKSPGWPLVEELSDVMSQLNVDDPTRYDFAITQEGMRAFRA